ncbi:hypothetical protein ACFE04_028492 [Oxalis oulophora]
MGIQSTTPTPMTLIFSYGTLKKGFSNHNLMQDLMKSGDAVFKGNYVTVGKYPLVCGPYRVPFLLNIPGSGQRVKGELYALSDKGLVRVDELEGTSRGHYVRLPIKVTKEDDDKNEDGEVVDVEAYFADGSYDKELWERNGKKGFGAYTEREAKGYVKRKDRPQGVTFLQHINTFVSSTS